MTHMCRNKDLQKVGKRTYMCSVCENVKRVMGDGKKTPLRVVRVLSKVRDPKKQDDQGDAGRLVTA